MSLSAFSFPFAHWTPSALSITTAFDVTTSRFIKNHLLLGLASGELSVFTVDDDTNAPCLQARLLGHQAPIIAFEYLETVSETAAVEPLFLSLSSDGVLSKWSLADKRCLQTMSSTTSDATKPRGMVIIPRSGLGEGRLTDSLILIYGCSTEIVVLNAESLETVFVWTGHTDWPIPVAVERSTEARESRECELFTILPDGEVQSWVMTGKRKKKSASVLTIRREEGQQWCVENRAGWGRVRWWQKLSGGYLVSQSRGISFQVADPALEKGFVRTSEFMVEEGVGSIEVETAPDLSTVIIKTEECSVKVVVSKHDQLEEVAAWSPSEFLQNDMVMNVAAYFDSSLGEGKLAVISRPKIKAGIVTGNRPGLDISIASITREHNSVINWNEKALTKSPKHGGLSDAPSACSEIFSSMLAVAHGTKINLYSPSVFLLSYPEPTASISLQCGAETSICLLKRVRISEYLSASRNAGLHGGKEYLVAGTQSGDLSLIESPSYHYSKLLPLFPGKVSSAHLLPSNLSSRLQSTLLVSSNSAVSIIDIERARVMVTFPSHDYSRLVSFATKLGQNVVALTYQDGVHREWNMGDEDIGVLLNPPPSRGPIHSQEEKTDDSGMWKVVRLDSGMGGKHCEEEGENADEDSPLQLCDEFCRIGLPTAAVNVRAILRGLDLATKTAARRTRPTERRVVGNHPAIINAKSLLTALVPGGGLGSLLDSDDDDKKDEYEDLEELKLAVDQFLFRRRRPAILGQIGAGNRVSMLTEQAVSKEEISPTITSIKLLAVLTLVSALLVATGREAAVNVVLERMIRNHLGKRRVALGVFAKFWSDANPTVRWVARECLDAFMSALTENERNVVVEYWRDFLPVHVPPELSSAKEVVRAVILLGKLITDYDHSYDESLKKSVARSAELLLHEPVPIYQDTAIEVIGYSWTSFEKLFDAYSAIHSLIRIYSTTLSTPRRETLHRCFLEIAAKNSPLLASSLATNISNGSPSSTPTASFATHQLQGMADISAAAMRIVTYIVLTNPSIFSPVLTILIEAVLKTLESTSGLRETVLSTVTDLVDALVTSYPTLAFHRPSQRLALSAAPGIIVVYDLKTSQAAYVLDGYHHLGTELAFSIDGKCLAAVDRQDELLLVWRLGGGILSYLGSDGDKTLQPKITKAFESGKMADMRWTEDRKIIVRLEGRGEVEVTV
ncbi:hypothetical protein BDD12DRAFT_845753 [Trichophaea hybrida]|nr:hypothetical protein BDD12DRAFT_845753 [Trichophaea hybrida]